jgi:hypothetical protein
MREVVSTTMTGALVSAAGRGVHEISLRLEMRAFQPGLTVHDPVPTTRRSRKESSRASAAQGFGNQQAPCGLPHGAC